MSNKLETIETSDSVQEAAKKMRDKRISSLLVLDRSNKPIGIITELDLERKVCANDSSSKSTSDHGCDFRGFSCSQYKVTE